MSTDQPLVNNSCGGDRPPPPSATKLSQSGNRPPMVERRGRGKGRGTESLTSNPRRSPTEVDSTCSTLPQSSNDPAPSGSLKAPSRKSPHQFSPLERQWSMSNITDGAVVPGFGNSADTPEPDLNASVNFLGNASFMSSDSPFGNASFGASFASSDAPFGNASFSGPVDFGTPLGTPVKSGGGRTGRAQSKHMSIAGAPPPPLSEVSGGRPTTPRSSSHRTMIKSLEDDSAVTSILHDAARITNWRTVLSLCKTHPQCAQYAGPDGWTGLHHACNRRCPHPDVVEALVRAYPGALLETEEKGMTPLHYACRFKLPRESVRTLLHLYPAQGRAAVSKRDRRGRTPLYYAVRYDAPEGVVEMLLEVDPSVVLDEDRNADSPLGEVWDTWADKFEGKRMLHPFLRHLDGLSASLAAAGPKDGNPPAMDTEDTSGRALERKLKENGKLSKKWKKVNIFLRAAFCFPFDGAEINGGSSHGEPLVKKMPLPQDSTCGRRPNVGEGSKERCWRILHAASAVKCHPTLFLLARALHPEQASEFDENDLYGETECGAVSSHKTVLHFAAASPANGKDGRAVILSLLALNPSAAETADGIDGSLPLHLVAENERKTHWIHDGVRDLYNAFPAAVSMIDKNGRLPLHRAAAAVSYHSPLSTEEAADLSAVDANWSVLRHLLEAHPDACSQADKSGLLPLHIIAEHAEAWDSDFEAILRCWPSAPRARAGSDVHNRLPIHIAASSPDSKLSLVERLIEAHPRGVQQTDRLGKLPLHLACESGKAWEDGTGAIYDAYPSAISEAEGNGRKWTALHMAAASPNASMALIEKLTQLRPQAAGMRDCMGRYPLHLAAASGKGWSDGGLREIFDAYPEALISEDDAGLLPLFTAALAYCDGEGSTSGALPDELEGSRPRSPVRPPGAGYHSPPSSPLLSKPLTKGDRRGSMEHSLGRSSIDTTAEHQQHPHSPRGADGRSADGVREVDILFHLLSKQPTVLLNRR